MLALPADDITQAIAPNVMRLRASCSREVPTGLGWNFPELADLLEHEPLREAAVLIGLVPRPSGWHVLLTQRTEQLSQHAGQVSFPGGRLEVNESAMAAAIRECEEEVGIPAAHIDIIGYQPRFATISAYVITPVVAILSPDIAPSPQQSEVASIFEAPLELFIDSRHHLPESREFKGRVRSTTVIPYQGYRIWGATASIMLKWMQTLQAS